MNLPSPRAASTCSQGFALLALLGCNLLMETPQGLLLVKADHQYARADHRTRPKNMRLLLISLPKSLTRLT